MIFLNASNQLWTSSRNTMVAMALGCSSLALMSVAPANYAFAQDASSANQATRSDAQIQTDAQRQLSTAPGLKGQQITAISSNGVVTLSGTVTDEVSRQLAENAVSGVPGVKSVNNQLSVGDVPADQSSPDQAPTGNPAPPPQSQASPAQTGTGAQQGANNGWGPAGPPPDAVNGQVPPPPAGDAQTQGAANQAGTTYGPPMNQGNTPQAYPQANNYPQQGAYPNQGTQYPNGQVPARPAYQRYNNAPRPYVAPSGPVTVPAGTLLTVRLQNYIDARRIKPGDVFIVNAARDVFQNGVLAIPIGATLEGHVVAVKKPGAFSGGGDIQVELTQLDLDGQSYPIATDVFSTLTPGKGGYSAANTIGGAAFGAILGAAIGGGPGAAVGAVAGGAGGAAISSATPAPRSFIPAETMITFHLRSPATIQPVSPDEATRLAASMPRPVLRPRPAYYGPPPGYYGYPYYR